MGIHRLEFRYLVNPLIALALLGGVFAADLAAMASSRIGGRSEYSLALFAAALLVPSLIRDLQLNHLLKRADTRTIARLWILSAFHRDR